MVAGGLDSLRNFIVRFIRMPGTSSVRCAAAATGFGLNGLSPPLWLRKELTTTRISSSESTPAAWRSRRESGSSGPSRKRECRVPLGGRELFDTGAAAGAAPWWLPQRGLEPGGGLEVGGPTGKA